MKNPKTTQWSAKTIAWFALLLLITAISRLVCISHPYFVDGPRHIRAIEGGTLVIQAPGYYLFNLSGQILACTLHCSAAQALQFENFFFGELAVLFFALLCLRRFMQREGLLLTACYAASPVIWFVADVHSTYASTTAFAPLLFLCCEDWDMFPLTCFFWALMTGFRPSDGVFVLPWLLWQSTRHSWPTRIKGAALALPVLLAWLIPTVYRFGGWMGLLRGNKTQATTLAQGVLTGHLSAHSVLEILRVTIGMLLGWGLLFPIVIAAFVLRSRASLPIRSALLWTAPGLLFFTLYYTGDPIYVAYFIAPGLIAAGYMLSDLSIKRQMVVYTASITALLVFMLFARPIAGSSTRDAVLNAYVMKFTRWSLKHEYAPRLATLIGACNQPGVVACQTTP